MSEHLECRASERASAHARIPFQSATCSDGDGAGDVSASKTERKMAFGSLPSRLTGMYYSSIAFAQKARHTVRTRTHVRTHVCSCRCSGALDATPYVPR